MHAEINAKIQEVFETTTIVEMIPPENYTPEAAMIMMVVLNASIKDDEENEEFDLEKFNATKFDLDDIVTILTSRIEVLLAIGDQHQNDADFLQTIWPNPIFAVQRVERRHALVTKLRNLVYGPPAKKKGGRKSKNKRKKNKSRRR